MIRNADREAKSTLYNGLDLRLTYHPVERTVRVEADLNSHGMYKGSCPRGDSDRFSYTPSTRPVFTNARARLSAELALAGR